MTLSRVCILSSSTRCAQRAATFAIGAIGAIGVGSTSAAAGELAYSAQAREVMAQSGSACEDTVTQGQSAASFDEFMASVTASGMFTTTEASQTSSLCTTSVVAQGSTCVEGAGCVGSSFGSGDSMFSATFTLDEESAYTLKGSFCGYAACSISGPSLNISAGGFKQTIDVMLDQGGMLAPGQYVVSFCANSASIDQMFATGSFNNVALRIAGSPDLDGSDQVDGGDLGILLGAWGPCPACCAADLNADGEVNGADLGILLAAFVN